MNISVVVVDDEPLAVARLERFLNAMPNVDLLGTGDNGGQAVALAKTLKPDVMLLDIEMPDINGLVAAKTIFAEMPKPPAIIFCTAYDNHAVEAFSANAVGYLLKPVSPDDLNEALRKAQRLSRLQLQVVDSSAQQEQVITISQGGYLARLPATQILYFRAEGKAVVAGLDEDREVIVDYTLKTLEERLSGEFIRVHRNSLVNKRNMKDLTEIPQGGFNLGLKHCHQTFPVSRRHLAEVRAWFKSR